MPNERAREQRWIILSTDGRHITLGRYSNPTQEEISRAEGSLLAEGLAGWLVVMKGDYYASRTQPELTMVCPLATPAIAFEDAALAFKIARVQAIQPRN